MSKVKIYTTPTCVFCLPVKRMLQERGVDFQEVNVAGDPQALADLREKTGQTGVPVTEVGERMIIGFDRAKLKEALDQAGL